MLTILQHDSAAKLVDAIQSACNDESVRAILQADVLGTNTTSASTVKPTQFKSPFDKGDDDVDDSVINNNNNNNNNDSSFSSLEEYMGSGDSSPTDSAPPLPLSRVRPALSKLSAVAQLIDRMSASYDADDARDLLGDTNAWHSFEDYTETIDALYDRYRAVLGDFADAVGRQEQADKPDDGAVSAETYREGMQALTRVLRGSCDPLPYRLRQVHTALVGSTGGGGGGGDTRGFAPPPRDAIEGEARTLLRAANDRCIEEADDFVAYYVTVRRLFLHLVASEAKAVMVMAVALLHSGVPHYIQPSDVTMARQLLAEQDAFLDRIVPSPVARLAELVLAPSSTEESSSFAGTRVTIHPHAKESDHHMRPSPDQGSQVVCADKADPFVWTLEAAQALPTRDGDAVGRSSFYIRGGTSSSCSPATYLECDDKGAVVARGGDASGARSGTWKIAVVQLGDVWAGGKAVAGAATPVAFRMQYCDANTKATGHGKWLALVGTGDGGGYLGLRDAEEETHQLMFDMRPARG